ncbi:hypothetical protein MMC21_006454 [Puttea exsequens]|nr:hypothetical protein [Puttea exsequens]
MASTPSFYRKTSDPVSSQQFRYSASDFHTLTNRISSSPPFTPDSALEPRPAECINDGRTVTTADKRASSPVPVSPPVRVAQQSRQRMGIRKTSCSSVKEEEGGIAQSFLESVNASVATPTDAVHDAGSPTGRGTCDCCCRCGRSPTWQPGPGRKRRSKSYTALRTGISELSGWDLELPQRQETVEIQEKSYGPGEAPLERLPAEVLDEIISQLAVDVPPAGYGPRNVDLVHCLLTSRTIHVATINTLYNQITLPHSSVFAKFLTHLNEYPGLGTIVRRLDLSHFTSVGLGRSRQSNAEIQNLTSKTMCKLLDLTPAIQEVLLQENLDDDIDRNVLQKLFFGLPKLRAVDFCASASQTFVDAFSFALTRFDEAPSTMLGIRRLGLYDCFTLPSSTFENLLPHLPGLTHLDVYHTRITDQALQAIPNTANLSHLNLGRCTQISGEGIVDFLTGHNAAKKLGYLNLACDIAHYRLLEEADVDRLLPTLPSTLRSLNLNGAQITARHIQHLLPLTKHLEELGLACADLSLADVNTLFRPPQQIYSANSQASNSQHHQQQWQPPTLHYIDLTAIPSITQSSLFNTPAPTNILLTPATLPLEVIELGDKAISSLRECRNTNKRLGWVVKELGRRGWYVRDVAAQGGREGKGKRGWKMGAMWWGMRKVPVAWGEVGGLYGHYMFKK